MADPVPEAIVICVDDSRWMSSPEMFKAQCDAIEHYCKLKFQEHPDTVVGLHTLGAKPYHLLYPPTRDLTKILDSVQRITFRQGELNLSRGLAFSRLPLLRWIDLPDKSTQTRLLLFVGGLTDMSKDDAEVFAEELNMLGVAVDIVNLYPGETLEENKKWFVNSYYRYGRIELYELFKFCNKESHFLDVKPGSDICQQISETIFKKTPQGLSEKQNDNVEESEKQNDNVEELEPSSKKSRLSEKQNDNVEELEESCLPEKQNDNDEEMEEESGWVNVIDADMWSPC